MDFHFFRVMPTLVKGILLRVFGATHQQKSRTQEIFLFLFERLLVQ